MQNGAMCQQQEEYQFLQAWDARMADLTEALDTEYTTMLQRQAQEMAELEVRSCRTSALQREQY
jgi:recombinational DNA repair ATPase RecF